MSTTATAEHTADVTEHNTTLSVGHDNCGEYHEVRCDGCGYDVKWASPALASLDHDAHARTGQRLAEPGTTTAIFNADTRERLRRRGATRAEMQAAIEAADPLTSFDKPQQHPAVSEWP